MKKSKSTLMQIKTGQELCHIVSEKYKEKATEIIILAEAKYKTLCDTNPNQPKKVKMHTIQYIYPSIAMYQALGEILQDKQQAYDVVAEGYQLTAQQYATKIQRLLKIPFLYRIVPTMMKMVIHSVYGPASGFEIKDAPRKSGECHIDMLSCPYYRNCKAQGCPELTTAFCNSDDIAYGNMHPKLHWGRKKTLGRGDECCDFMVTIKQ